MPLLNDQPLNRNHPPSAAPTALLWAVWLAYALCMAYALAWHLPWRDEIDPWAATRNATMPELLSFFRTSGHPPLWHMVLLPFSRLGAPSATLQIIQFFITTTSAWLILFRCPLPLWLRIPMLFSSAFMYRTGVIARGYGLMTLILCAIAAQYPHRLLHPRRYALLLMLLLFSEVHILYISAILCLFFLWDLKSIDPRLCKRIFVVFALAALAWLIIMWPPAEYNIVVQTTHKGFGNILYALSGAYLPDTMFYYPAPERVGTTLLVLLLTAATLGKNRLQILFIGEMLWLSFVFYNYYGAHHNALLYVITMFVLWLHHATAKPAAISRLLYLLLAAISMFMAYNTYKLCLKERETPASGGKDMAEFIRSLPYQGETIAYLGCHPLVSIGYYMPEIRLWQVANDRYANYILWDKAYYNACETVDDDTFARLSNSDATLVLATQLIPPKMLDVTLLHKSRGATESYVLYHINRSPRP
jgi:hypothetical protein